MRLDVSCIRSILLALESYLEFDENLIVQPVGFETLCSLPEMQAFSKETILYSSQKLDEAGLISFEAFYADNALYEAWYSDISYEGHQFLEGIRSPVVFTKTKNVLSKVGSFSLSVVSDVAAKVIARAVNQQLGIN